MAGTVGDDEFWDLEEKTIKKLQLTFATQHNYCLSFHFALSKTVESDVRVQLLLEKRASQLYFMGE